MCEYCGCRDLPPIAEPMDEHIDLVDQEHYVRQDLGTGRTSAAMARMTDLVVDLDRHVQREEDGSIRGMLTAGEFLDEIDGLEGEHPDLAAVIAVLDPDSADFAAHERRLLDDLATHCPSP